MLPRGSSCGPRGSSSKRPASGASAGSCERSSSARLSTSGKSPPGELLLLPPACAAESGGGGGGEAGTRISKGSPVWRPAGTVTISSSPAGVLTCSGSPAATPAGTVTRIRTGSASAVAAMLGGATRARIEGEAERKAWDARASQSMCVRC